MTERDRPRRTFAKQYDIHGWDAMQLRLPTLEKLAQKGLIPEPLLLRAGRKNFYLYTERVNGFNVESFPRRLYYIKFSNEFAVQLAKLCQGFYDNGAYHEDLHEGNVMYDLDRKRPVAVDLDSIVPMRSEELATYVDDFSELLTTIFLGYNYYDVAQTYSYDNSECPDLFKRITDRMEEKLHTEGDYTYSQFRDEFAAQVVDYFFVKEGIPNRVDARIIDFILRSMDPRTSPQSFDEILALKQI